MATESKRGIRGLIEKSMASVDTSVEMRTDLDLPDGSPAAATTTSPPSPTKEPDDGTKVYPGERKPALGVLIAMAGPATGNVFAVDRAESVLGRSPNCAIHIDSEYVALRQLRIIHERGRFAVQALRGPNPVLINGAVLKEPAELHDGDLIAIADTRLSFRTATPPHN